MAQPRLLELLRLLIRASRTLLLPGTGFAWGRRTRMAAAVIAAPAYFGAAYWAKISYQPDPNFTVGPDVAGEKVLLLKPFSRWIGSAFVNDRPPLFESVADTDSDPHRSPVELYENNTRLGPAHSPSIEIAQAGGGRFAHRKVFGAAIYLSASDNTDPNTNGRAYWIVKPPSTVASTQD